MIESLERCLQKVKANPFTVARASASGLWVVWEDFGCGIRRVVADFAREEYAQAFVLAMIEQPELNWPSRVR